MVRMKKPKSDDSNSAAKSGVVAATVDEYLAGVPEPARSTLNKLRAMIRSIVPPESTEAISYRIPTFRYKGPLVGFAAFPDHCSLFVMSSTLLDSFTEELKDFETSKGTVRFPVNRPLSAALVKKLVEARMALNEKKVSSS
jgi:uncharacterized protein YdhG (YjbR/CyaY superfamily)